jgi:hypothetical protein
VELDPLVGLNDANKPLLSKLLAVPALRAKYLGYVRDIAQKWLDWNRLGPVAEQYHTLIAADVQADTRKLDATAGFLSSLGTAAPANPQPGGRAGGDLKSFAEKRRAFLLNHAAVKATAK